MLDTTLLVLMESLYHGNWYHHHIQTKNTEAEVIAFSHLITESIKVPYVSWLQKVSVEKDQTVTIPGGRAHIELSVTAY